MKHILKIAVVALVFASGCNGNNPANTEGVVTADSVPVNDNTKTDEVKMDTTLVMPVDTIK